MLRVFRPYKSLIGYLHRFTLLKIGRLHIRTHRILSADDTPFCHTHPFNYISVILSGGYTEELDGQLIDHSIGSVIIRNHTQFHRIHSIKPNTKTLFCTWDTKSGWELTPSVFANPNWVEYPPGVYQRELYGVKQYCKFDRYWHKAHDTPISAAAELRPSIDQKTPPISN